MTTKRRATPSERAGTPEEPLLVALDRLVDAADDIEKAVIILRERAVQMRSGWQHSGRWRDVVDSEERPRISEMLTDTIQKFEAAGTRFRQAKARALYDEGMTMEQIAELFGLTRQRISVLLNATARDVRRKP